ncbi:hypothetical protein [Pseudacidovorax sp. RU35E]|uniref:hypothetical protein n=1 Tax=Pseudacidovorax sp. RU35E TaxID=1907403 RepID=UPI000953D669|nr:hypothetical protein [Pseudacidovorax sp. RU35E]SIQ66942.1 hypothetical protein SAMN05880557_10516 [Pseudacidovorax sp. RU35E]
MKVRSTWRSVRLEESALEQALHRRHSLRMHGWLIGSLVLLVMGACSALLRHAAEIDSLALRYLITLGVGYLVYLGLLRMWARRLLGERRHREGEDWSDVLDLPLPDLPPGRGGGGAAMPHAGGGDFAGAGAHGEFAAPASAEGSALGDLASGAFEAAGSADEGAIVVVPVVAVFLIGVALLLGAGSLLWLYFGSEALLAVAVEVAFSYAAARTTRRLAREGWLLAAVRLTWKPLLGALLCAVLLGAAVDRFVPQADTLPEALRIIAGRR